MPRPLATGTIFELVRDIIEINLLTKFRDDRTINVASRVLTRNNATIPWRPLESTETIFELVQDITGTHLLTKVLTRKNAPPTGGHFHRTINVASRVKNARTWQAYQSSDQINEILTINVASRVLTRKMLTPHDGRRTKGDHKSSP
ncbi:hypothetical protein DPMN_081386 [Dreissena polymorpha]|uniref:Uncharacterized protein n=1 Tax=Dreissena polymorpha TaxID=45954 RepID=A0A9D3Y8Q7_DREPO|nr:hypothetical protein DPMN_081386 [Dreissena polymorpha]